MPAAIEQPTDPAKESDRDGKFDSDARQCIPPAAIVIFFGIAWLFIWLMWFHFEPNRHFVQFCTKSIFPSPALTAAWEAGKIVTAYFGVKGRQ